MNSALRNGLVLCILFVVICSCSHGLEKPTPPPDAPEADAPEETSSFGGGVSVNHKIKFDMNTLDERGLIGPVGGKRPIEYEFKIPKSAQCKNEVSKIDPSVKFMPGSRGRIGANKDEILCIGSTHQPGHKEILLSLAALPYVERIIVCFYE